MIYVQNSDTVQGIFIPRSGNEHVTPDVPLQNKDFNITENGDYPIAPDSGYQGISGGTISVEVVGPGYDEGYQAGYSSGYTEGETAGQQEGYSSGYTEGEQAGYSSGYTEGEAAQKALLTSTAITSNGTYQREDGWNEVVVNVPTSGGSAVLTSTTLTDNGEYYPDPGVDGFSAVTVDFDTQPYVDQGYQEGYTAGEAAGESAGYQNGYADGEVDGANAQKALLTSTAITSNGTYQREDGWNEVVVNVGGGTVRQFPALTAETQAYSIPEGQYGDWQLTYTSSTPTHKFTVYFPVASGACEIRNSYRGSDGSPVRLWNTFAGRLIATTFIDGVEYSNNPQDFTWNDTNVHDVVFKMLYENSTLHFQGCDGLLSVDFSDVDTNDIPDVSYCHNLSNVNMPQLKRINTDYAVETTSWDVNWDNFPLIERIESDAFKDAKGGNLWSAPKSLKFVGHHAFWNSSMSTARFDNDQDITVEHHAFQSCDNMADLSLVSVVYLGKCAFLDCTGLTDVEICSYHNMYGRTNRYFDYTCFSNTGLQTIYVNGPELPPTIIDEDANGAVTTNPFSNIPQNGTIHLQGASEYASEWRTWIATYLPGWTIDEVN